MTESTNFNVERFHPQPAAQQDQSIVQIAQDGWNPQSSCGGKKQSSAGSNDNSIKDMTNKIFRSEDTTPGFSRMDGHGGDGLLTPASLGDNLRKAVKEQFSEEDQAKYANEGYHLYKDNQNRDMSMHIAVYSHEKALENDIVENAFGKLSLIDQAEIHSGRDGGCSSDYAEAIKHFGTAISREAHEKIKALQHGKGLGTDPFGQLSYEIKLR